MTEPMEVSTNASGRRVANGSYRKEVRPAVVSSAAHLAPVSSSTQKVYAIIGPDGSGKSGARCAADDTTAGRTSLR